MAVLASVAAYWMLALSPKREQATKLSARRSRRSRRALDAAEAELATYEVPKSGYKANYTMIARLGKAVPADDDVRSLLVQINSAAEAQQGRLPHDRARRRRHRPRRQPPRAQPPQLRRRPGATTVGSAGFSTMPFTFSFKGSFFSLGDFFNRLDRFVTVKHAAHRRHRAPAAAGQHLAAARTRAGFPTIAPRSARPPTCCPATQGLDRRRDAVGPGTGCRCPRAPGATATPAAAPPTATVARSHPMSVFKDIWRFLVQRKLWPVAILLVAAAVAVPKLLAKEPAVPVGRPSSPSRRQDSVLATEPIVALAADGDRAARRQVLGSPQEPLQAEGDSTPTPDPVPGPAAGDAPDTTAHDWRHPRPCRGSARRHAGPRRHRRRSAGTRRRSTSSTS